VYLFGTRAALRDLRCGENVSVHSGMAPRYRCTACGNLTRFDVRALRRTLSFHHYTVGGELTVEEENVLEERVEWVGCRWCGAEGDAIQAIELESTEGAAEATVEP